MTNIRRRPVLCQHGILGKSRCRECRREYQAAYERRSRERRSAAKAGKVEPPMQPARSDRCGDCGYRLEFDVVNGRLVESCPRCEQRARDRARLEARRRTVVRRLPPQEIVPALVLDEPPANPAGWARCACGRWFPQRPPALKLRGRPREKCSDCVPEKKRAYRAKWMRENYRRGAA